METEESDSDDFMDCLSDSDFVPSQEGGMQSDNDYGGFSSSLLGENVSEAEGESTASETEASDVEDDMEGGQEGSAVPVLCKLQ
mmetsp:Transcript_30258/g.75169  ORF Transcript_30258/g.75169 Transcript_30258/m.75169 type:complete len:84 (-) Transcript_30258:4297-4548(-)